MGSSAPSSVSTDAEQCPSQSLHHHHGDGEIMCNENSSGFQATPTKSATVICLNVGGRMFYTTRSTLTRVSETYFAERFRVDSSFPLDPCYIDNQGIPVFFIDRSGDHFDLILEYLRMGTIPLLSGFYESPLLWRWLREEAKFYCLQHLSNDLRVVYSCCPTSAQTQGVLRWLGTDKGKSQTYKNPLNSGFLRVNCWNDLFGIQDILSRPHGEWELRQRWLQDRAALVEHKPCIVGLSQDDLDTIRSNSNIVRAFGAGHRHVESAMESATCSPLCCDGHPVEIEFLGGLSLNITHYSLRWDGECLMQHWRFEASVDRQTWEVLHSGADNMLVGPSEATAKFVIRIIQQECETSLTETNAMLADLVEGECRRTFEIEPVPDRFFRYFRFVSDTGDLQEHGCLHGVGLELYGQVSEFD